MANTTSKVPEQTVNNDVVINLINSHIQELNGILSIIVAQSITDGVTLSAPSQNAVHDALALKQALDTQLTAMAALTYTGNAGKVVTVNGTEDGFELAAGVGSAVQTALVKGSGSQVLTNGNTDNFLQWQTVVSDPLGFAGGDNTTLTVPAGVSKIEVLAATDLYGCTVGAGYTALVFINGSADFGGLNGNTSSTAFASTAGHTIQVVSPVIDVSEGDTIKISIRTEDASAGSAFNIYGLFQIKVLA